MTRRHLPRHYKCPGSGQRRLRGSVIVSQTASMEQQQQQPPQQQPAPPGQPTGRRRSSQPSMGGQTNGDMCRICHCEADAENALISPCYCAGSLRFVHQACLQQWIKSSDTRCCELCKFDFIMHTKIKPFRKVTASSFIRLPSSLGVLSRFCAFATLDVLPKPKVLSRADRGCPSFTTSEFRFLSSQHRSQYTSVVARSLLSSGLRVRLETERAGNVRLYGKHCFHVPSSPTYV